MLEAGEANGNLRLVDKETKVEIQEELDPIELELKKLKELFNISDNPGIIRFSRVVSREGEDTINFDRDSSFNRKVEYFQETLGVQIDLIVSEDEEFINEPKYSVDVLDQDDPIKFKFLKDIVYPFLFENGFEVTGIRPDSFNKVPHEIREKYTEDFVIDEEIKKFDQMDLIGETVLSIERYLWFYKFGLPTSTEHGLDEMAMVYMTLNSYMQSTGYKMIRRLMKSLKKFNKQGELLGVVKMIALIEKKENSSKSLMARTGYKIAGVLGM